MKVKYGLTVGMILLTTSLVSAQRRSPEALFERFDKNKNGRLEKSELPKQLQLRFESMDLNKDGSLNLKELEKAVSADRRGQGNPRRPGEINTPPARGERYQDKLKTGQPAPDFTLPTISGKEKVKLSSFRSKKPVVLIFGSYT